MELNHGEMINDNKIYIYNVPKMKGVKYTQKEISSLLKEKKEKYFRVLNVKKRQIIIDKLNGTAFSTGEAELVDQLIYNLINTDDIKFELSDKEAEEIETTYSGFDLSNNRLAATDFSILEKEVFDKIENDTFDFSFEFSIDGELIEFVYSMYELTLLNDKKEIIYTFNSSDNLRTQLMDLFEFK